MSRKHDPHEALAAVRTPTIEERLTTIKETTALFMLLSRGLERTEDIAMDPEYARYAWSLLSALTDEAMESAVAIEQALPSRVLITDAPDVPEGGAR